MRLTRAGEYAVRCVLYLAAQGQGVLCARKDIAREMNIPDQFLGKIAQQLARAGLIEIIQGSKGGFRLIAAPDEVALLDVVEAVIGEIFLNDCIMRPDSCNHSNACAVHGVWSRARSQLRQTLREASFAKILSDSCCLAPFAAQTRPSAQPLHVNNQSSDRARAQGTDRLESGAAPNGCEAFERPAPKPPGIRQAYEATSKAKGGN